MIINAPIKESEGFIMANQSNEGYNHDLRDREQHGSPNDYLEESSAEIASPIPYRTSSDRHVVTDREETGGKGVGVIALILSIVSLFVMPIILGVVGIVLGFVARRRGAVTLGSWAISLGAISIIIGIFIAPFF
jgi:hypothetical protein